MSDKKVAIKAARKAPVVRKKQAEPEGGKIGPRSSRMSGFLQAAGIQTKEGESLGDAMLQRKPNRLGFLGPGSLQAKLKIGQPGDKYEQEADAVADKVVSTPAHSFAGGAASAPNDGDGGGDSPAAQAQFQSQPAEIQEKCADCDAQMEAEEPAQTATEETQPSLQLEAEEPAQTQLAPEEEASQPALQLAEEETQASEPEQPAMTDLGGGFGGMAQSAEEESQPSLQMEEEEAQAEIQQQAAPDLEMSAEAPELSMKSELGGNDSAPIDIAPPKIQASAEAAPPAPLPTPVAKTTKPEPKEDTSEEGEEILQESKEFTGSGDGEVKGEGFQAKVEAPAVQQKGEEMLSMAPNWPEIEKPEAPESPKMGEEIADKAKAEEGKKGAAMEEAAKEQADPEGQAGNDMPQPKPFALEVPPEIEMKEDEVQGKDAAGGEASAGLESSLQSSKGGGQALTPDVQAEMGGAMGADFSGVRVHTGPDASSMNQQLGAKAFTHGSDIYFNEGNYDTGSSEGKHLLAHELTHTVQQGAVRKKEDPDAQMAEESIQEKTIQRVSFESNDTQTESNPANPNDGPAVEGKSTSRIKNDPDVEDTPSSMSELDEDEKEKADNPDRGEVRSEKSDTMSSGAASPDVDRGSEAQSKTSEQAAETKDKANEQDGADAPEGDAEKGEESEFADAEAAEAEKTAYLEKAANRPIPKKEPEFIFPKIEGPEDSEGKALPRRGDVDTQVRGLAYMGELIRKHGYELKMQSHELDKQADASSAAIAQSKEDLGYSEAGTAKFEDQNEGRKEIAEKSKTAHDESVQREEFVKAEAPKLSSEADKGAKDSGGLKEEAESKASKAKGEKPSDPDAAADAEKQAGDMNESAEGAASVDDAITQTGERAEKYLEDAQAAGEKNKESKSKISETDDILTQTEGKINEFKAKNAASQAQIQENEAKPDILRQYAVNNENNAEGLIRASFVMEAELQSIQESYLGKMKGIEPKEAALKRKEEEEKKKKAEGGGEVTAEQQKIFELNSMDEKGQEETVAAMDEKERTGIMGALDSMISEAPDKGSNESEGARKEFKSGLQDKIMGGAPEADPRQEDIQKIEDERIERVGGVKKIADANFGVLTEAEKAALSQKLVAQGIADDIGSIDVMQMGKGMIQGMIDPRQSLVGVVDGFDKFATGIANIFNADAWAKDPLGNLLQVGADITTGLAMIFSSILGIAGMITALMVAITIISWGFASPVTMPVIGWMGTIMTYAGWGAIIAGSLSVLFNYYAYIKNLSDAATATSSDELFGEVEQMKTNASDAMTGAMAIVEGVGAVKMGPVMKNPKQMMPDFKNVTPKQWAKGVLTDTATGIKNLPGNILKGAKSLISKGKKGLIEFKEKLKGLFSRKKPGKADFDLDTPDALKRNRATLEGTKNKKGSELSKSELDAELANAKTKDAKQPADSSNSAEIEMDNGHKQVRDKETKKTCRNFPKDCDCNDDASPEQVQDVSDKLDEVDPDGGTGSNTSSGGGEIPEAKIKQGLPEGEVRTPAELKKARQYFNNNKSKARARWEERTGKKWPTDPETGRPVRASHERPLADGGDPMTVEPKTTRDPNTEHNIPDPETGLTDHQRWGKRQGDKPRGGARTPITDSRIIDELPPGQVRTPDEVAKARQYFKNRKKKARKAWEERTGKKWPTDPETGNAARASHTRPLADGGHPLEVEPGINADPLHEHMTPDPQTGQSDMQRFGSRRRKNTNS